MSVKKFSAIFVAFVFLAICAATLWRTSASREIASVGTPPQMAGSGVKVLGKHDRMMDVFIEAVDKIPDNTDADIEVRLRARVILRHSISGDLDYKWTLPEGVHVVAGQLKDGWNGVGVGQEVVSEITLSGVSKDELKTILFDAYTMRGDVRIGGSAAFTTQPENFAPPVEAAVPEEALKDTHL